MLCRTASWMSSYCLKGQNMYVLPVSGNVLFKTWTKTTMTLSTQQQQGLKTLKYMQYMKYENLVWGDLGVRGLFHTFVRGFTGTKLHSKYLQSCQSLHWNTSQRVEMTTTVINVGSHISKGGQVLIFKTFLHVNSPASRWLLC